MLGKFLELSVTARPIGESFEFYRSLGFAGVPTGDIVVYPYAVVHDGQFCVGLHERGSDGPLPRSSRPRGRHFISSMRLRRCIRRPESASPPRSIQMFGKLGEYACDLRQITATEQIEVIQQMVQVVEIDTSVPARR